jgi:hypothetical protein
VALTCHEAAVAEREADARHKQQAVAAAQQAVEAALAARRRGVILQ